MTQEFSTEFKIISNRNPSVYVEGYVDINGERDEDCDWHFWNGTQYQNDAKIHHDDITITGATWEQENEINQFHGDWMDVGEWIADYILQSEKGENRTVIRGNCTLIINEGAKMECEIIEPDAFLNLGDYVVEVIPFFNGKRVDIASYMAEYFEEFDPWNVEDSSSSVKNGHIFFEMSKDYWDDDCKEERLAEVNEEARRIYAMALTRDLGIYAKYGEVVEQQMDDHYENEWLFKMSQFLNRSDEELDAFLREEGYIEELDY